MSEKNGHRAAHSGRSGNAGIVHGEPSAKGSGRTYVSKNAHEAARRQHERGERLTASGRSPQKQSGLTVREEMALQSKIKDREWSKGITRVKGGPDTVFLVLLLVIISIGIIMVYSASYPTAINEGENGFYYAGKQLVWVAFGAACMGVAILVPSRYIRKLSFVIYGLVAVLLLLVLIIGTESGGAQRWIKITGSLRLQPSELAKFSLPVILAWYCEKYGHLFKDTTERKEKFFYGVMWPSVFVLFYAGLIALEKHLSGLFIVVAIGIVVMFLGGAPVWMTAAYYSVIGSLGGVFYLIMNPYALRRIKTFFDANADNLDENWQTYQGSLAIGSGGFLGIGLGQSRQKNSYVSEAQNDFIFTIWCEEMGFVGAVLVIVLFMALLLRGYKIALKAPDTFSSLMVFGIMTQVGLQVILNLLVVTDNFMNTGISLPFLSYGGSSLIVLLTEMGIVLSVSRRSYEKQT
ncbi:MAG: cell division protein FtsW [Ruminococcaceae bacterium]|nr:cell division protein FtsW [Oscillospiraceae bacterium]